MLASSSCACAVGAPQNPPKPRVQLLIIVDAKILRFGHNTMHTETDAAGKANAARASTRRPARRSRRRRRVLRLLPATGATIGFAVRVAMTATTTTTMTAFYSSGRSRLPSPWRRCGDGSRHSSPRGFAMLVDAIRANPNPIFEYGMEGATTNCRRRPIYIRGDERVHWYEDKDGYTLIDDTDDEYDEMRDGGGGRMPRRRRRRREAVGKLSRRIELPAAALPGIAPPRDDGCTPRRIAERATSSAPE